MSSRVRPDSWNDPDIMTYAEANQLDINVAASGDKRVEATNEWESVNNFNSLTEFNANVEFNGVVSFEDVVNMTNSSVYGTNADIILDVNSSFINRGITQISGPSGISFPSLTTRSITKSAVQDMYHFTPDAAWNRTDKTYMTTTNALYGYFACTVPELLDYGTCTVDTVTFFYRLAGTSRSPSQKITFFVYKSSMIASTAPTLMGSGTANYSGVYGADTSVTVNISASAGGGLSPNDIWSVKIYNDFGTDSESGSIIMGYRFNLTNVSGARL